jgi:hypothetical protein
MTKPKMLAVVVTLATSVVFACGDDPEEAAPSTTPDAAPDTSVEDAGLADGESDGGGLPKAGSRLVPRFLTTSDGLKAYVGILDTKLDAFCVPTDELDTVKRCAPATVANIVAPIYYVDKDCTQPVVRVINPPPAGCTQSTYVGLWLKPGTGPCSAGGITLHKIKTAKIDLPNVFEKSAIDGKCSQAGEPAGSFTELTAIPSTDLVKMTDENDPVTPAIGRHVYAGEDGSRFPAYDLSDRARQDASCVPGNVVGGKTNCIPASGARSSGFVDPGCTKEGVLPPVCAKPNDPNAIYVRRFTSENCGGNVTVYEIGPKRPTRDLYFGGPGNCSAPNVQDTDVFDIGAEVPASKFPELTTIEIGGTRILTRGFAAAGVPATFLDEGFTDKTYSMVCRFSTATDGKLRCLPENTAELGYSDANCQTKIAVEFANDCAQPKFVRTPVDVAGVCGPVPALTQVGAKLAGTTAFRKTQQGCTAILDAKAIYALGSETPPASFAEGTYVPK